MRASVVTPCKIGQRRPPCSGLRRTKVRPPRPPVGMAGTCAAWPRARALAAAASLPGVLQGVRHVRAGWSSFRGPECSDRHARAHAPTPGTGYDPAPSASGMRLRLGRRCRRTSGRRPGSTRGRRNETTPPRSSTSGACTCTAGTCPATRTRRGCGFCASRLTILRSTRPGFTTFQHGLASLPPDVPAATHAGDRGHGHGHGRI